MGEGDKRTVAQEADALIGWQLEELMKREPRTITPTEALLMREASLRFSARSYVILKEINASLRRLKKINASLERLCRLGQGEVDGERE
jgi:hypothetical protein